MHLVEDSAAVRKDEVDVYAQNEKLSKVSSEVKKSSLHNHPEKKVHFNLFLKGSLNFLQQARMN